MQNDAIDLRRWVHTPASSLPAVLVAVTEPTLRIEASAALVGRGVRIALARTAGQAQTLLRTIEIAIVDARVLRALGLRARAVLRNVVLLAVSDGSPEAHDQATELGAFRIFAPPVALDELVSTALAAYSLGMRA